MKTTGNRQSQGALIFSMCWHETAQLNGSEGKYVKRHLFHAEFLFSIDFENIS